jgi:hypothetical protein
MSSVKVGQVWKSKTGESYFQVVEIDSNNQAIQICIEADNYPDWPGPRGPYSEPTSNLIRYNDLMLDSLSDSYPTEETLPPNEDIRAVCDCGGEKHGGAHYKFCAKYGK